MRTYYKLTATVESITDKWNEAVTSEVVTAQSFSRTGSILVAWHVQTRIRNYSVALHILNFRHYKNCKQSTCIDKNKIIVM